MRLDINLASRPYEDVGQFYRTWGALLGIAALVTIVLVGLTVSSLWGAHTVGRQTAELEKQMAQYDQQKRAAQELLNKAENRDLRDRSRFLNSLIARKAFSWTEVFADLEKIVPARVRVTSIKPNVTQDNQITVEMKAETDSREKNIELVRRLNSSRTFRDAVVRSESVQAAPGTGARTVLFDIEALYSPRPAAKPSAEAAQQGAQ